MLVGVILADEIDIVQEGEENMRACDDSAIHLPNLKAL